MVIFVLGFFHYVILHEWKFFSSFDTEDEKVEEHRELTEIIKIAGFYWRNCNSTDYFLMETISTDNLHIENHVISDDSKLHEVSDGTQISHWQSWKKNNTNYSFYNTNKHTFIKLCYIVTDINVTTIILTKCNQIFALKFQMILRLTLYVMKTNSILIIPCTIWYPGP